MDASTSKLGRGKRPKGRGTRQRVQMRRIQSEEARQVCFSKRRKGLIKKSGELSMRCGSVVGIIAFSPGGKAFSYGHPNLDAVLDRFQHPHNYVGVPLCLPDGQAGTSDLEYIKGLQEMNDSLQEEVVALRKKRDKLEAGFRKTHGLTRFGYFWESDVKELNVKQIQEFIGGMNELSWALEQRMAAIAEAANMLGSGNDNPRSPGGASLTGLEGPSVTSIV